MSSLSFSTFFCSKGSARARERWAAKPLDARNESGSHTRFARGNKKKERLLVVKGVADNDVIQKIEDTEQYPHHNAMADLQ